MAEKTEAQLLKEEKERLYMEDVEGRKAGLITKLGQLQSQQESLESQLVDVEIARVKAQKLLEELETRYPTPEVPAE